MVTGLEEKEDEVLLPKAVSFLLSAIPAVNIRLLLSSPDANGNSPVVGDGQTCSGLIEALGHWGKLIRIMR